MPEKDSFGQKKEGKKSSLKMNLKANFGLVSSSFYQPLFFIFEWFFKIDDMQNVIILLFSADGYTS